LGETTTRKPQDANRGAASVSLGENDRVATPPPTPVVPTDSGRFARCTSVLEGVPGLKQCQLGFENLAGSATRRRRRRATPSPTEDNYNNQYRRRRNLNSIQPDNPDSPAVSFGPSPPTSCPDGIGWQGVYEKHYQYGGRCLNWFKSSHIQGSLKCERHACLGGTHTSGRRRSTPGSTHCSGGTKGYKGIEGDTSGSRQTCQKMHVMHVDGMSRQAGLLVFKRSSCLTGNSNSSCSVFKTGLCIDLGYPVWSSGLNTHGSYRSITDEPGGMLKQQTAFGKAAQSLLKANNNILPEANRCSNTQNQFKTQRDKNSSTTWREAGTWSCWHGCSGDVGIHQDETLAKLALMNY